MRSRRYRPALAVKLTEIMPGVKIAILADPGGNSVELLGA